MRAVSISITAATVTNSIAARTTYPIPAASPIAMARNIDAISLAFPCAERKRTRLNAPATATPAPIFPFTSIITVCTTAGSTASAIAKLCVHPERYIPTSAAAIPSATDTAVHMRKTPTVRSVLIIDSSTEMRLLFAKIFFQNIFTVACTVFRKRHRKSPVFRKYSRKPHRANAGKLYLHENP